MTSSDKHILNQEQQSESGRVVASTKLSKRSATHDEYIQISPALQKYGKPIPPEPSSSQWKDFSIKLDKCLEEELSGSAAPKLLRTWKDRISATDSKLARVIVYAAIFLIISIIAATGYFIYSEMNPKFHFASNNKQKQEQTMTRKTVV